MSKEVTGGFLVVTEYGRCKQLRGFRPMPFLERFLIESDIVHNIREPTGIERPRFEVAENLGFDLSDNNIPLFCQISAQVLRAEC